MGKLLILESPNKIKKVSGFLRGFSVKATVGHVKDLPAKEMGVDLKSGNYEPTFVYSTSFFQGKASSKKKVVDDLKAAAKGNDVYIATDPDREGYAIGRHIYDELKKVASSVKRVEFNEITEKHVNEQMKKAIDFTKTNSGLYDSFLGRRVADRIVGYILSNIAIREIGGRVSVGRVQSPAVRLVVDREREIRNFKPTPFYILSVDLEKGGSSFKAFYASRDKITDKAVAGKIVTDVKKASAALVKSVERKDAFQNPVAPFTTSTLQMAASTYLKMAPERTMAAAQALFGAGMITYMRTDSTKLSDEFIAEARQFIGKKFGAKYVPGSPRTYKSKNSQAEAHEAIRPTHVHDLKQHLSDIQSEGLSSDCSRLFDLIYKRAVGCQMAAAVFDQTTAVFDVSGHEFKAKGRINKFDGYLALMGEASENLGKKKDDDEDQDQSLPPLADKEKVKKTGEASDERMTKPPARFTEGSLVKMLEDKGIGRPSTYASIIGIIKGSPKKGVPTKTAYVSVDKVGKLSATREGEQLVDYLAGKYPWVIDYDMTKNMEDSLDQVEEKKADWRRLVKDIHGKMDFITSDDMKHMTFISGKAKQFALDIARSRGEESKVSTLLDDAEALRKYIETNKVSYMAARKPSEKQVAFAQKLADQIGVKLTAEIAGSMDLTKKFIDDAMKKAGPLPLSEKQIAILEKNGQGALAGDPVKAKAWIDDYFKNKFGGNGGKFSKGKGGFKKTGGGGYKKNFKKSYAGGGSPGR